MARYMTGCVVCAGNLCGGASKLSTLGGSVQENGDTSEFSEADLLTEEELQARQEQAERVSNGKRCL